MSCGGPHELDCSVALERLYELLDGEISSESDIRQLRQHLDECAPCLDEYTIEEAMRALLRRSCVCESAPDDLRRRIMVQITEVKVHYQAGYVSETYHESVQQSVVRSAVIRNPAGPGPALG